MARLLMTQCGHGSQNGDSSNSHFKIDIVGSGFLFDSLKLRAYSRKCLGETSNKPSLGNMDSYPSRATAVIVSARRALNRHNRIDLGGARRESKART